MFQFNKQLAALAFLTLIVTGTTGSAAAQNQTPAEQLCQLRQCRDAPNESVSTTN